MLIIKTKILASPLLIEDAHENTFTKVRKKRERAMHYLEVLWLGARERMALR